jgi:16S rRNA (guanine527-N7)-methyltransferase
VSFLEILESELQTFQIELNVHQKTALGLYCEELARWNKKINLTSLSGAELVRRLVVEPVWVGLHLRPCGVLLDIGSGNGSPAIPLQVICSFQKCHLIEARLKRAAFLRHVSAELSLPGMEIHRDRFEEIVAMLEPPDWITLQAVALTQELMTEIRAVSKQKTKVVWMTSSRVKFERQPARVVSIPITGTQVYLFENTA